MATRLSTTTLLCLLLGCQSIKPAFDPDAATAGDLEAHGAPRAISVDTESSELSRLPEIADTEIFDSHVELVTHVDSQGSVAPEPNLPEPLPAPLEADKQTNTDGLALDQLVDLAMGSNPAVARAAAQVRALRGKWVQVGLAPNPSIGYLGEDLGDLGTAGKQGGFIGQKFVTGGKLQLNRAVVSQEIVEAEQKLATVEQRVLTDVRAGYYRVLIAERQIETARELLKISQEAVQTSEALLRAREVSEVALLQNSMQAQDAQILLRRAEYESSAAWSHLSSIVGVADLNRRPLAGELEEPLEEITWDDSLERLLRQSPEIASAAADLSRARWALRRALVQVKPDVNVQLAVQHDARSEDVIAGVQLGVPVPILDRNQGAIRQARAEITAAERNIERLELQLRDRLADEFKRYASSRYEVEMYSSEILPKARRTLDLVTRGYRLGEVGYLNQLAAQRTFFQTNLSYIQAQRGLWNARLRIDGLLLDGSLQDPK